MLTVQYARAFSRDPESSHVTITSATPGYTATDMNDFQGTRSVSEGAKIIVDLALGLDDAESGGFFDDRGRVPW